MARDCYRLSSWGKRAVISGSLNATNRWSFCCITCMMRLTQIRRLFDSFKALSEALKFYRLTCVCYLRRVFDFTRRCADRSTCDFKVPRERVESTDLTVLRVIRWSICAAAPEVEWRNTRLVVCLFGVFARLRPSCVYLCTGADFSFIVLYFVWESWEWKHHMADVYWIVCSSCGMETEFTL